MQAASAGFHILVEQLGLDQGEWRYKVLRWYPEDPGTYYLRKTKKVVIFQPETSNSANCGRSVQEETGPKKENK